jgi:hypothetical protein
VPRVGEAGDDELDAGGGLLVVVVAALLLASCEDVAQQCPPLAHPPVLSVRFDDAQSACHNGDYGFRVVVATNAPPFPPPAWKHDGLPVGIITAFRLPKGPPAVSFP